MASYKLLVILTLFVTCLSLANSTFSGTDWAQTETIIPNDETDTKEPQGRGGYNAVAGVDTSKQRGGCRYGCCGSYANGQCSACCSRPQAVEEGNTVETSKQRRRGCKYGCCGSYAYGQCSACCSRTQAVEEANSVESSKQRRGGCKYGCCGSYAYGRCSACCSRTQVVEEGNNVETSKQRRGCKYGCCGSYAYGQCSACCSRAQAEEQKASSAWVQNQP